MNHQSLTQAMIRQIVAHARCAMCGHRFAMGDVRVLGRRGSAWAMSAVCRECRTQALFLAVMSEGTTRHIYTDLSPGEWERFKVRPAITVDDVIDFYVHMDAYDGDLSEILDEPLPAD